MCTNESSCGCATDTADSTPTATASTDAIRSTYTVSGMTCGGCAKNVSRHVSEVAGVTGVEIDVASGNVTVVSDSPVQAVDIREAVERAGYQLVG